MGKLAVFALMFAAAVVYIGADSPRFYIKHSSSGKYLKWISVRLDIPYRHCPVTFDANYRTTWTFQRAFDHWVYIIQLDDADRWVLTPERDSSWNKMVLLIQANMHWGALWALDGNDYLISKRGGYACPDPFSENGYDQPVNGYPAYLCNEANWNAKFQFVSTTDSHTKVEIYERPTISGKWKLINVVRSPMATHTDTFAVKIGKSTTESRTSSFTYSWEVTSGFNAGSFSGSVTAGMQHMIETASSSTWAEEVTRTREIQVQPGETVATWQYVFEIEQELSKAVFQSNFLADTGSMYDEPDDIQVEF